MLRDMDFIYVRMEESEWHAVTRSRKMLCGRDWEHPKHTYRLNADGHAGIAVKCSGAADVDFLDEVE